MAEYRRKRGYDFWHWCPECTYYPFEDYFTERLATGIPHGRLCDECLTRARRTCCTGSIN